MADEKLSALTEVTSSADADLLYTVQNGNSRKTTRAKVLKPTVRHDIDQALLAAEKEKARQNISAAALDSTGIVPRNQLPPSLFAGTGTVASEAAMLALDVPVGFTAVRTDISKNFVLNALPASNIDNWVQLATPTASVFSVAGKLGDVELDVSDIIGLDEDLADIQAAMLVKSAQVLTAAEQGQVRDNIGGGLLAGFRNKLINGDFDVWQRGTSFTVSGYTADRWAVYAPPGNSFTAARAVYGTGTWGLLLGRTATGTGDLQLYQRIENVRTLAGKTVTVTFNALKTGSTGGTSIPIDLKLTQVFGAGGSANVETAVRRVTATASVSKLSVTFDLPSVSDKTTGEGHNLSLVLSFPSSAGNFSGLYLSRISLVEGDATKEADPFSPRHIQQEIALCQRYYCIFSRVCYGVTLFTGGLCGEHYIDWPVKMRVSPTLGLQYTYRFGDSGFRNNVLEGTNTDGCYGYIKADTSGQTADFSFTVVANAEL